MPILDDDPDGLLAPHARLAQRKQLGYHLGTFLFLAAMFGAMAWIFLRGTWQIWESGLRLSGTLIIPFIMGMLGLGALWGVGDMLMWALRVALDLREGEVSLHPNQAAGKIIRGERRPTHFIRLRDPFRKYDEVEVSAERYAQIEPNEAIFVAATRRARIAVDVLPAPKTPVKKN